MIDLDALQSEALARLKHSIGTSAGMHKRQIRIKAERLRAEADAALRLPLFLRIRPPRQYLSLQVVMDNIRAAQLRQDAANAAPIARVHYDRAGAAAINLAAGEI